MGVPLVGQRDRGLGREDLRDRVRRSLSSGLLAFVFDSRLISPEEVEGLMSSSGLAGLLDKWVKGSIVVYYVNEARLRRKCLYEECSAAGEADRERCVKLCLSRAKKALSEALGSQV